MKTTSLEDVSRDIDNRPDARFKNLHRVTLGDQYERPLYAPLRDHVSACTSNACSGGDKKCPTPDACQIPESKLDAINAGVWLWLMAGLALWAAFAALMVLL